MLVPAETLLVFVPAALALNLTPGNDMLFCLGQGMRAGPRAGIAASLGIAVGGFIHVFAAALGLAALLAAHPGAFEAIRWAGVAYLVWLAVQALRAPGLALAPAGGRGHTPLRAFREAVLVNVLNPKVAVFILAFLPQFVDPARGSGFLQFLLLGTVFNVGGTLVNAAVGGFAGRIGGWLTGRAHLARAFQRLTGVIFLGLAARLAFERR
ncbi:LysE family translocator [Starkeya koreensis]|uniref:LysE family translocator n=1 Tax=Ancylobacter koreensis TaxID=266121 RepID=A0ABT0DNI5_9HYPH|nr:LysE family translocator [Ancylobacter koreensis]MCK0208829.1 LysE family translocator [Ancylobacter koreensis]